MEIAAASEIIKINSRQIKSAVMDVVKSAKVVNLHYVSDTHPGISRVREGDGFVYKDNNRKVNNKALLARIKALAIPPAWEDVWICKLDNGHLQATGKDALGRKQYRYHALWNTIRNTTKFYRLLAFGKQLPAMRKELQKHLALPGYPREKILALVVSLLERTHIRIGNGCYEKLYGSFGLTTLKNKHVTLKGTEMTFTFRGKKGIHHKISLRSRRLAEIVKACRDIPGKDLFEFIDEHGQVHHVDSGMVNAYIHAVTGGDFSAKDFRTWAGSLQALDGFHAVGDFDTVAQMKANILTVLDGVAGVLGNTRTVCKKYYVHPLIITLYEQKKLAGFLEPIAKTSAKEGTGLDAHEEVLMRILEKNV